MSLYIAALFLHVSGAIGAFGSLLIWLLGLCISLPFWTASLWRARQPGEHLPSA